MSQRKKGMSKKQANRTIEEELGHYNDAKNGNLTLTKSVFENYQYLSNKERAVVESKFAKPKNPSQRILEFFFQFVKRNDFIHIFPRNL